MTLKTKAAFGGKHMDNIVTGAIQNLQILDPSMSEVQ